MKIGVYINGKYEREQEKFFSTIRTALNDQNCECLPIDNLSDISRLDVLLVLGGDGTILSVAAECARCGVKILGVNCGHLGFLTDFDANQLGEALKLLVQGKYGTVKRSMLQAEYRGRTYFALNEVVVQRSTSGNGYSNSVNLHAEIDGSTVDNFSCDGLIVSTPTGSTAYSLSAGGSILAPNLEAFIMTPICPHSLHSRPIVFSDKSTVKIRQNENKCTLNLIIDGKVVDTVQGLDEVTVTKAERTAEFLTVSDKTFFDKLLVKLDFWSK